ncbi:hypothetical protein ALC62_06953 [Cyphomyrmex costatus]|uniref:HAUS augmin-like complex subunit 6 N-terminal domain-containing protein n=1 Tax=Cyphomyrmex costatus TaxID=456900 RepID=A0A195CND0_9HYME|nr:hypothetical protein ALC62_06953 [Cyphomyrmex costatus]
MAISASFHRNITLLNQLVPPDHDFKKHFREGMFDKPNTAGFIYVSHYLLTIYDAERFKRVVEWPVICKKTETKYRNNVKDYLNVIALENPDIGFPRVVTTYLHHASGTKFITIMWKLSQLVIKTYLMRDGEYEVIFAPKPSLANDLVKTYLQQSIATINSDILSRHRNYIQMEKDANFLLAQEKEHLKKIKAELFDKKQSLIKCASSAPVTKSSKQRLADVEDTEIVSMWKNSLNENIQYIRKRNMMLHDLEKLSEKTSGLISNLLNNVKALDNKQLEKINCSQILEHLFSPNVQHCLHHLYNDNRLVYQNFIHLFTLMLYQIYQSLRKDELVDLAQCLLQVEASAEDMKSMCNVFKTFLANMISSTEEMPNVLCVKSIERISEENILPFVKNVLLMPSPLIKINTNCTNQKSDTQLQFTPGEIAHKSLFSRYMRHNRNCTPDLKTNLYISHININSHTMLDSNEKQELRFVTPKMNQLFNSSMISLQSTAHSNSVITSIEEIPSSSDFNLDAIAKSFFNWNEEVSYSSEQLTPKKQNVSKVASQQAKDLDCEIKVNKPELDEFTEVQILNDDNKGTIVKRENDSRRRSISDLVERYKKILEASNNSVTAKLENKFIDQEIE